MIPAVFLELDYFPLTPNGKIDRKALAVDYADAGAEGVPAGADTGELRTALQQAQQELLEAQEHRITEMQELRDELDTVSRALLRGASQGTSRTEFLREASAAILSFTGAR